MNKALKNKGFSLVELLIVIAIMAILAGAIVPAVVRYIDTSRKNNIFLEARELYNETERAIVEFSSSDRDSVDVSDGYTHTDPQEGNVGVITNVTIANALNNPDDTSGSDADIVNRSIACILDKSMNFDMARLGTVEPYNQSISTLGTGKTYIMIVYNNSGVRYVELLKKGFFVHYAPNETSDSVVKIVEEPDRKYSNVH